MAYFAWKGINLKGMIQKGKLFARSTVEVDELLLKQEIALLSCHQIKQFFLKRRSIPATYKIQFFKQCAQLLQAGVLLPDALQVIASQAHHNQWHDILSQIATIVSQGSSLSQAMEYFPIIFDPMMINMIYVGQESDNLIASLNLLGDYILNKYEFARNIRSAAMVPLITLCFFFSIAIAMLIFIIPHFIIMFASVQQELPIITRMLINASNMVRSHYVWLLNSFIIACIGLIKMLLNTERGLYVWHSFLLRIPCIGFLIMQRSLALFLQALAMLTAGGMHLVPALSVAKGTIGNSRIKRQIEVIEQEVQAGSLLSQAMLYEPLQIFGAHAIAIIKVGEESGKLTILLQQTAQMYQETIKRHINVITMLINPSLMIILGLLITFLVFAVYLPIFNLSNIM